LRETSFNSEKIVWSPRISVRSLIKKIIVAYSTDKGDAGRLIIIANKCSIIRNAPGRMNMHLPRQSEGDQAVTETRKAEAGEGDKRRKAWRSVY
jgi:hypothetical protein